MFLLKDTTVTPVRLEPAAPQSRVKHFTTEPHFVFGAQKNHLIEMVLLSTHIRAFFHHFGTMTHTPGIGNFSAKMPKIGNCFSAFSYIVKS